VLLYTFQHPGLLTATNCGLYAGVAAAGPAMREVTGGWYGDGIRQGRLELINVTEDLLAARRALYFPAQGPMVSDGWATHLAINGAGYFVLKNPTNGSMAVTRGGMFGLDGDGFLTATNGWRVQGYADPQLSVPGNVRVSDAGRPAWSDPSATMVSYGFESDGRLIVRLSDGTEFVNGQVLLQNFEEPFVLKADTGGFLTNMSAALPFNMMLSPLSNGLGAIVGGALEVQPGPEDLKLPSRKGFRLRITGEPGQRWAIQATKDFAHWKTLTVITNAPDEAEFVDGSARCLERRFYRVGE
jgi:hypothetical protein